MTENEKQDVWDAICDVDADRLDLLYQLGDSELRTQIDARFSIRGRCQTLLILLITGISAAGMTFLLSKDMKLTAFLWVAIAFWTWHALNLFNSVKSTPRTTAHGLPTDNIFRDKETGKPISLEDTKRRKLYAIEVTINEIMAKNKAMAVAFNSALKWSFVGFGACAAVGVSVRIISCFF